MQSGYHQNQNQGGYSQPRYGDPYSGSPQKDYGYQGGYQQQSGGIQNPLSGGIFRNNQGGSAGGFGGGQRTNNYY